MSGSSDLGILVEIEVIAIVGWLAYGVFLPAIRSVVGRKRSRRSTLDRLERESEQQPAVRIVVADGDGRLVLGPLRLAGVRPAANGATVLECINDDGSTTRIDSTAIVAIAEV